MTPVPHRQTLPFLLFLALFFAVWSLRATIGFSVDESINAPIARAPWELVL